MMMPKMMLTACSVAAALCLSGPAFAQAEIDESEDPFASDEDVGIDLAEDEDDGEPLAQDTTEGQALDAPPPEADAPPPADDEASFLIGLRYRSIIVPKFLINAFGVDGARTLWTNGIGPEFGYTQKNFEILGSVWYADYGMDPTGFREPNAGPGDWEIWESHLAQMYITADFLWKTEIARDWDFHIGAGAGVGVVFTKASSNSPGLQRTEAYFGDATGTPTGPQGDDNPTVGSNLYACQGPGVPSDQCDNPGDYGAAEAWPVYPWLAFQTGIRYSPVKQFVARLDLGISSSGFWFGLGADYGL